MSGKDKLPPIDVPNIGTRTAPSEQQDKTTYTLAELLAMEVTELPCLFAPVFLKSGLFLLAGESDTGKSSFLRQMAMSVATGRDFMEWKYQGEHHRAIYFSSEDDVTITARVLKLYNKTMQLNPAAAQNLRFEFDINPDTIVDRVATMLKEQPADLVIIDALGDAFNGKNLNDNTEVRKFYAPLDAIAKEANCLIVFNHHNGKRSAEVAPSKDNSIGSQALAAKPRGAAELRTDPASPDIKHFCIVKANYLPSEYKTKSYAMRMDENLVFTLTGERADFAELAKSMKPERKPKTPEAHENDTHRAFIRSIFASGELNQTALRNAIRGEFELSDRPARAFIEYYEKRNWIAVAGKGKQGSIIYKSLVV